MPLCPALCMDCITLRNTGCGGGCSGQRGCSGREGRGGLHFQGNLADVETTTGIKQGCKFAPTLSSVLAGRLIRRPIRVFGLEAVRRLLIGYADDFTVHRTFRSKADLRAANYSLKSMFQF